MRCEARPRSANDVKWLQTVLGTEPGGDERASIFDMLNPSVLSPGRLAQVVTVHDNIIISEAFQALTAAEKSQFYVQAARFFASQDNYHAYATRDAESAFAMVPGSEEALALLESLLVKCGDVTRLATIYLDAATHETDPSRRARLLTQARVLLETHAATIPSAVDLKNRLVRLCPHNHVDVLTELPAALLQ